MGGGGRFRAAEPSFFTLTPTTRNRRRGVPEDAFSPAPANKNLVMSPLSSWCGGGALGGTVGGVAEFFQCRRRTETQ
jgi:hypothetical protein